jgi:hypothetical protein
MFDFILIVSPLLPNAVPKAVSIPEILACIGFCHFPLNMGQQKTLSK